jgi:effector-binding domain-containing protein
MPIIKDPNVDYRDQKLTMGIRTITPFRGMFAVVDKLRKELNQWLKENDVEIAGPFFLRYHVIDMAGDMDIEFGVQVAAHVPGNERVTADILPAGRYANLTYVGSGMTGNKTLIQWARDNELPWDRWDDERGDGFRCRYEAYLTDPQIEHRKTKWEIDLAIKLADEQ